MFDFENILKFSISSTRILTFMLLGYVSNTFAVPIDSTSLGPAEKLTPRTVTMYSYILAGGEINQSGSGRTFRFPIVTQNRQPCAVGSTPKVVLNVRSAGTAKSIAPISSIDLTLYQSPTWNTTDTVQGIAPPFYDFRYNNKVDEVGVDTAGKPLVKTGVATVIDYILYCEYK